MRVAVGRQHLEDSALDAEDRDIERAAAEIVHCDVSGRPPLQPVGERRRGRLVDQPHHFEPGQASRVLGRLPLAVVEVGRHRDDDAPDFFLERLFRAGLERAQDLGRDLRRRVDPRANLEAHDRAAQVREGVAMAIRGGQFVAAKTHVALHRADHGALLAAGKADRADPPVAFDREMRFRLDRRFADQHASVGRERDHRGQQRISGSGIGNHARHLAVHHGDQAVGGPQVYAENAIHLRIIIFSYITLSFTIRFTLRSRFPVRDRRRESECEDKRSSKGCPSTRL